MSDRSRHTGAPLTILMLPGGASKIFTAGARPPDGLEEFEHADADCPILARIDAALALAEAMLAAGRN